MLFQRKQETEYVHCSRCGKRIAAMGRGATVRDVPCPRCGCTTQFIMQMNGTIIASVMAPKAV